jgi:RNA polymerase sigma factor (sigma-70 family)
MSDTDLELLARYTRHHAEEAFAEIVRRHLDLVFSAALRQVRSTQLAEEVAQTTFISLARGANRLAPDTILAAWLYQVAHRTAANVVRRESRRQLREQIATEMNAMNATAADWTHIEPLLDEAMHALDDTDRTAVLLRYFENKSLREVGATLGTSENAAQKRLGRAVERLREFFARRGVTVGASGLVVVISANAVQAAPVGLAVTISTAAALAGTTIVTPTATIPALKLMSTAALKPIIVASAAIAVSMVIVIEHNRADRLREQNESLQAQVQKTETASAELSERLQTLTRERENDPRQTELLRLRGEVTRLRGLETELAKLREESLRQQEQSRAASAAQAATQEAIQKFDAQRARTINAMKIVGLQLRVLAAQNNLNAAFTADGNLNPALLAESLPNFDLRKVELLVNDPSQLGKLLDEAPETIVARTAEPIPTPDGRWLRVYTLADGSVQHHSTEWPNQAFDGNWHLGQVKARP